MQGKSPLVQVKEPGNLDMVACRLSSCNQECTKYTCTPADSQAVYRERKKEERLDILTLKAPRKKCI